MSPFDYLKQNLKLTKLVESKIKHDPKNIIFSQRNQETLLIKGLNFAMKFICVIMNFCSETFQKLKLVTKPHYLLKMSSGN